MNIDMMIPIILKESIIIDITPEVINVFISSTSLEKYASKVP